MLRILSLLLDIWASANATASSALPVRVWLYGGSNMAGGISNPLYDQCNVPDTNAIAVSLNYRLGPLGFLALDSADFGGNQAVLDQLLGLQWVQENIAAFGGDPVSSDSLAVAYGDQQGLNQGRNEWSCTVSPRELLTRLFWLLYPRHLR